MFLDTLVSQCRNVSVVQVEHHSQPYSLPLADFHVTPLYVPFSIPYHLQNLKYASVAVIAILLASLGVWLISAQSWFGGQDWMWITLMQSGQSTG